MASCPYLGVAEDRDSHLAFPDATHLCFAADRPASIALDHQATFCLTAEHPACPRFAGPPPDDRLEPAPLADVQGFDLEPEGRSLTTFVIGALIGISLLALAAIAYYFLIPAFRPTPVATSTSLAVLSPTATQTATPAPSDSPVPATPTAELVPVAVTPSATTTPAPGVQSLTLAPDAGDIGWVTSSEERGNHFGDSFLYAGILDGEVYQGAFQFDLGEIPRGAPIYEASLQLTGLRDDRLGEGGTWTLRLLGPEIDEDWRRHGYQEIFNAPALQALSPVLGTADLGVKQTNTLELSPAQIRILEERILKDEEPKVSYRVDGPLVGPDNLFTWDTGYGPESQGDKVTLTLRVGPAPATPPPLEYVVVTSVPTPENVLTAAAVVVQVTADATRIGTATPTPPNLVTATPLPQYLVMIPVSTPENEATAQALAALATAEALTTGTPTPLSAYVVTATATPTATPTSTSTPTPTGTPTPTYVLMMASPTPASAFAAATRSAAATAQAKRSGTPTPLPANWATPIVVTSTPTPANQATAQAWPMLATAQAFTTGTPTPTPANMVTATSTPVYVLLAGQLPPMTAIPYATATPGVIPRELIGKIAFKSDRSGEEKLYVVNPDGSGLALLSDRWPYDLSERADAYSADGRFRVFVKDVIRNQKFEDDQGEIQTVQLQIPTLFFYDALYKAEEQMTHFGSGAAFDPAWSPAAERIALVSNDSGNDEIWVINRDGSGALQLTRNAWEWDKHPSWSPDGTRIAFWSNRTGNWQIWVMNADGSNLYSLSKTGFNDWDPVWIKYRRHP